MAEPDEQAPSIAAMLARYALDSSSDPGRPRHAVPRCVAHTDLLTLMKVSLRLLERQGEGLAAHHVRQAVEVYGRYGTRRMSEGEAL